MEVVDRIVRGDVIRSIIITESARPASNAADSRNKTEKKTPASNTKKKKRAEN
jgi:hypothetical protein